MTSEKRAGKKKEISTFLFFIKHTYLQNTIYKISRWETRVQNIIK